MKLRNAGFAVAMIACSITTVSMVAGDARAQQFLVANDAAVDVPVETTDKSLTVENDKVSTSAEHHYNSPAERAADDLLITEVKSSLLNRGISDGYPVEVDCDHGTVELSGVVASADDAREAQAIAMNTKGVVGVKNKLTWR
jgi:osmotically-inducible protein OsmY